MRMRESLLLTITIFINETSQLTSEQHSANRRCKKLHLSPFVNPAKLFSVYEHHYFK